MIDWHACHPVLGKLTVPGISVSLAFTCLGLVINRRIDSLAKLLKYTNQRKQECCRCHGLAPGRVLGISSHLELVANRQLMRSTLLQRRSHLLEKRLDQLHWSVNEAYHVTVAETNAHEVGRWWARTLVPEHERVKIGFEFAHIRIEAQNPAGIERGLEHMAHGPSYLDDIL